MKDQALSVLLRVSTYREQLRDIAKGLFLESERLFTTEGKNSERANATRHLSFRFDEIARDINLTIQYWNELQALP